MVAPFRANRILMKQASRHSPPGSVSPASSTSGCPNEQTLEGSTRPPRTPLRPRSSLDVSVRLAGAATSSASPQPCIGRPCPRGLAPASIWHFAPSCPGITGPRVSWPIVAYTTQSAWVAAETALRAASLRRTRRAPVSGKKVYSRSTWVPRARPPPGGAAGAGGGRRATWIRPVRDQSGQVGRRLAARKRHELSRTDRLSIKYCYQE